MKNLKLIAVFMLLLGAASCSGVQQNVEMPESVEEKKRPQVATLGGFENAEADNGMDDRRSLVVTILPNAEYYVADEKVLPDGLAAAVEKRRTDILSPVYINAGQNTNYGDVASVLQKLRGIDVKAIKLMVESPDKKTAILKAWLAEDPNKPPVPKSADEPPPPPSYGTSDSLKKQIVVMLGKDGKIKLDGKEHDLKTLRSELEKIFKENEDKKLYREGTEEVYKNLTINAARSAKYEDVLKVVDAATGARPTLLDLQLDNLVD